MWFPPPPPFMPPSIVFLSEISVADHKQNPEWFACWCAEGAASNGAGERSNKARCLFHPSRRGESMAEEKKSTASTPVWRAISDRLNPHVPDKLPLIQRLPSACLPAYPTGCWSAAATTDGTSHFLIPGGLEFNLSRAPSEAKHSGVWVPPKHLKLERRSRTGTRFLFAWWARKMNDRCTPGRWGDREWRQGGGRVLGQNNVFLLLRTHWDDVSP